MFSLRRLPTRSPETPAVRRLAAEVPSIGHSTQRGNTRCRGPRVPGAFLRRLPVALAFAATTITVLGSPEAPTALSASSVSGDAAPRQFRVPAAITSDGSRNVSSALQSFIDTVPDGSTILFPPEARYLLGDRGIGLVGRRNLTLAGRGATLRTTGCEERDPRSTSVSAQRTSLSGSSTSRAITLEPARVRPTGLAASMRMVFLSPALTMFGSTTST